MLAALVGRMSGSCCGGNCRIGGRGRAHKRKGRVQGDPAALMTAGPSVHVLGCGGSTDPSFEAQELGERGVRAAAPHRLVRDSRAQHALLREAQAAQVRGNEVLRRVRWHHGARSGIGWQGTSSFPVVNVVQCSHAVQMCGQVSVCRAPQQQGLMRLRGCPRYVSDRSGDAWSWGHNGLVLLTNAGLLATRGPSNRGA